jgi:hypothetical protein
MGSFTDTHEYTNDPDTLPKDIQDFREKLEEKAIQKGALGTVADGDIKITATYVSSNTPTIDNPLTFSAKDAFRLEDEAKNHYLRFGALLEFIVKNIIPITTDTKSPDETGTPIIKIATEPWYQYMYSLPNQISLDPRVCLVRNSKFDTYGSGITKVLHEIPYFFKEIDNGKSTNENSAYPLNIYLNFEFIKECLKADEKGNVSVYELISNICTGLNKALGGVNNLEPVIDEETNTLQIIDTTPIPGHSAAANFSGYLLQIYGYDKTGNDYISNFVRKVDLKTAITPEYATMITVGATAGGYVKGTEATAFSRWNTGLTDRFKEKFIPPTKDKTTAETDKKEPATIYKEEFAGPKGFSSRYGFTGFKKFKLSDNFIEKNISIVTEYYKWLIAKNAEDSTVSGGTVGFIPFKLGLTLDGISGIKIYNVLRVNTEFLPKAYGKSVDLIVTGVSHRLNNNDWETSIEATVMPKTGAASTVAITAEEAKETLNEATSGGINTQNVITDSTGTWIKPAKEGRIGDYVDLSNTINQNKYKDLVNNFSNGIWPVALYYRAGDPTPYGKVVSKVGRRNVYASDPRYDSQLINWSYTGRSGMKKTATVHQSWEPTLTKMAEYLDKTGLWTNNAVKTWSAGILRRDVTPRSGIKYGQLSGHAFGMALDINSGIYPLSGGVGKYNANIAAGIQSAKVLKFLNEKFGKNNYPGANKIFWALGNGDAHHFAINKLV